MTRHTIKERENHMVWLITLPCPVCDGEGTVDRGPWIEGLCFECLGEKYEEVLETGCETEAEARLNYPDAVDMEIIE
jgi:DnaJ-class molecular chaperone|tara:strand:- start:183 stop:413 length:231 start_codon:yes stop_codon:yes gene_type:complete